MKERIKKSGIDYVLVGDYYIPDLKLPEENVLSENMDVCIENI